ncbi:MAG TPA: hypothetical protein ENG29_02375 [Firmicutes bacterium]|uniref:Uncharacterized protein n=1 Tax=Candidatus Coatesbacteria bacterium 4484_99 TaxID=1970774 RepID=A0A1W9S3T6_9BACT|nr:MAG: hypothetical protein B6D57_00120 [Candidatus Coatesbacteria bacterium 4484_99]RLC42191.1 MAG: hypothetical protein DRH51_01325 [Candidatus Coatesbacteria bacterium]HDM43219.1 hypothetical protein [Bacillota bacterium]RLC43337.1 MAG: hypothetical protein DRH49_01535 [Candidatus Coatesbacteria bacterium]RLC44536.1 MAG: hypothetical protein DRH44_02090 [Candidatus Coatesbacteria bacterium]
MKQRLPLLITLIVGLTLIVQFFSPGLSFIQERFTNWFLVVIVFAFLLGFLSLVKVNITKIKRRSEDWGYSIPLLIALFTMAIIGIGWGIGEGTIFNWLFMNLMVPMSATMFSLLAFFVASAAYRAFRARNLEAAMLLIAATIVMLGRVPISSAGFLSYLKLDAIANWIMTYPNTVGQRAIMIGAALGVVATSLRIILGIERAYMGEE